MINLHSADEVKKRFKQVKVQVPVYQVTVTNESVNSSTFLYTRYNLRANIHNQNAVEDRTFDVNKDGDSFGGVIKSRWKGKNNVLEWRATGRTVSEDQSGVIGMKGDKSNIERIAIQFHLLAASDGCFLAVSKGNLLPGSTVTSDYTKSGDAQSSFMSTIQSYQAEDKKNDFSITTINVNFERLHDNPNYKKDIGGEQSSSPEAKPNTTFFGWHSPMSLPQNESTAKPNYEFPKGPYINN